MRVGDFYCGTKSWSHAFAKRGHEIVTYDNNPDFEPDVCGDLLEIDDFPNLDAALFSPPCTKFTTMTMGRNWTMDGEPRNDEAANALRLVEKCWEIIVKSHAKFYVVENPRARLRTLDTILNRLPRVTVSYCRYGEKRMKPTDLWGKFPKSWIPRPMCNNLNPDHVLAIRGSRSGTQGMDSVKSGMIPYALSLEMCLAMEHDLNGTT